MAETTDPLGDAIAVLRQIDLAALSAHPDTTDAGSRVAVALSYLDMANAIMVSLAKECYVKGVIVKLGDYDREDLRAARKVVDAARVWTEDASVVESRLALHVAVEEFDEYMRALRPAREAAAEGHR